MKLLLRLGPIDRDFLLSNPYDSSSMGPQTETLFILGPIKEEEESKGLVEMLSPDVVDLSVPR